MGLLYVLHNTFAGRCVFMDTLKALGAPLSQRTRARVEDLEVTVDLCISSAYMIAKNTSPGSLNQAQIY